VKNTAASFSTERLPDVPPIRVLVVDDSAFTRKVLKQILSADTRIEVVGIARDGLEALEKIAELKPDVITLDLMMPELDGIGVLRALTVDKPPRVVVVSISGMDSELCVQALQMGAFDVVRKPTALATTRLYDLAGELVAKVNQAFHSRPQQPVPIRPLNDVKRKPGSAVEVVVVGTSTGGPQALTRLLTSLPANFPLPLAVALHIPDGYTEALARRLDDSCEISVAEASSGLELRPGLAIIARGGMHLTLDRRAQGVFAQIGMKPLDSAHHPSVDVLFESAAATYGTGVLGVVLTGMGDDGLKGSRAIKAAGGQVLTEAESSCIVYGMPRSVHEAGLSLKQVPLHEMASEISRML
jgi:two-component system, chemotaxis family, protein-glutamate methylesterase/glutaminase